MSSPPLSLYLHLPWCVRKCPYCDFNSHSLRGALPVERYVAALCRDLEAEAARAGERPLHSVFLGGGTPSLFPAEAIGRVLDRLQASFRLVPDIEVTMEANPGTLERDRLADYRLAGINRLSLGVQSFDDDSLARLGRIHAAADSLRAFDDASRAGFRSVNLDLMHTLPGQSEAQALADLERALALGPGHLSWYQLTLEPNTVFHARPPADLPDEDQAAAVEEQGQARLAAAGYRRYETSAWARPGFECRHNLNYWRYGDYLAVGAGAHGKWTDAQGRAWRYSKPAHPAAYMQAAETGPPTEMVQVDDADRAFEFLLNAWRLEDGFRESEFTARTGLAFAAVADGVREARRLGLIEAVPPDRWRASPRGRRFLNDLQALFLPAAPAPARAAPRELRQGA